MTYTITVPTFGPAVSRVSVRGAFASHRPAVPGS